MDQKLSADGIKAEKFVLVIGNARSGTTIVGSVIDSHARMICANETTASSNFWRNLDGREILEEIVANSFANSISGRPSEGYRYAIATEKKDAGAIAVIGDKVWNPALLLLAGDPGLLASLRERMGVPLSLIHCVRNPYDVIATMHLRSGTSLRDRVRWYTMHCEAIQMIIEREEFPMMLIRHEDLITDTRNMSSQIFEWLGHSATEDHLARVQKKVYEKATRSRENVAWPSDITQEIESLTRRFSYLADYRLS